MTRTRCRSRSSAARWLGGNCLPPIAGTLAHLAHEVIEAQIFRQMMTGADLDDTFARHVVDDIVLPLLTGSIAAPGPAH